MLNYAVTDPKEKKDALSCVASPAADCVMFSLSHTGSGRSENNSHADEVIRSGQVVLMRIPAAFLVEGANSTV